MLPAIVMAAVLVLAGCTPTPPSVTPEPVPSSTPVFASDEDALAAATAAYAKYLVVSDLIARDGGTGVERMKPLVTSDQYTKELAGFKVLTDEGIHAVGSSNFSGARLQSVREPANGITEVTIYACSDATNVRVVDQNGEDVTPPNRPARSPFELAFVSSSENSVALLLARSELWSGKDFC